MITLKMRFRISSSILRKMLLKELFGVVLRSKNEGETAWGMKSIDTESALGIELGSGMQLNVEKSPGNR